MTDATVIKPRGRPFSPGRSGNPSGRPKGSRNRATIAAEELLDDAAENLMQVVIELGLTGDRQALRMCLDRLVPPRRERPIRFVLPNLATAVDALAALSAIADAVANGELTDSEASTLIRLVDCFRQAVEAVDHERRLQAVEELVATMNTKS